METTMEHEEDRLYSEALSLEATLTIFELWMLLSVEVAPEMVSVFDPIMFRLHAHPEAKLDQAAFLPEHMLLELASQARLVRLGLLLQNEVGPEFSLTPFGKIAIRAFLGKLDELGFENEAFNSEAMEAIEPTSPTPRN